MRGPINVKWVNIYLSKHFTISIYYNHHHHVHEGLGVFPVPWSSKWNRSLHLFLGRPTFLCPFGLYCNVCFGILFVSIICTCCSHFSWYFISIYLLKIIAFFIIRLNKLFSALSISCNTNRCCLRCFLLMTSILNGITVNAVVLLL
jgi:hypothetical protein